MTGEVQSKFLDRKLLRLNIAEELKNDSHETTRTWTKNS